MSEVVQQRMENVISAVKSALFYNFQRAVGDHYWMNPLTSAQGCMFNTLSYNLINVLDGERRLPYRNDSYRNKTALIGIIQLLYGNKFMSIQNGQNAYTLRCWNNKFTLHKLLASISIQDLEESDDINHNNLFTERVGLFLETLDESVMYPIGTIDEKYLAARVAYELHKLIPGKQLSIPDFISFASNITISNLGRYNDLDYDDYDDEYDDNVDDQPRVNGIDFQTTPDVIINGSAEDAYEYILEYMLFITYSLSQSFFYNTYFPCLNLRNVLNHLMEIENADVISYNDAARTVLLPGSFTFHHVPSDLQPYVPIGNAISILGASKFLISDGGNAQLPQHQQDQQAVQQQQQQQAVLQQQAIHQQQVLQAFLNQDNNNNNNHQHQHVSDDELIASVILTSFDEYQQAHSTTNANVDTSQISKIKYGEFVLNGKRKRTSDCLICTDELIDDTYVTPLKCCNNLICTKCAIATLKSVGRCPYCRVNMSI